MKIRDGFRRTAVSCFMLTFLIICSLLAACGGSSKDISGTDVDVDLTKLGGNILYAQVYSMVSEPEEFLGKSVRMEGFFTPYDEYDKKGRLIKKAIWHNLGSDYPENDKPFRVFEYFYE